jgi:hypothetical protein
MSLNAAGTIPAPTTHSLATRSGRKGSQAQRHLTLHNESKEAQQEQDVVFVPFWPILKSTVSELVNRDSQTLTRMSN